MFIYFFRVGQSGVPLDPNSGAILANEAFVIHVTMWTRLATSSSVLLVRRELTLRRLMSYIYGAPILDVSRLHTTTQHSR